MNNVRAFSLSSRARAAPRAAYEYTAFYGSMLVFGLLCLSCSLLTLGSELRTPTCH